MRSDRLTPNETWQLVHDAPNCIKIQNDLRNQGITGVIQAYENLFNPSQVIYTYRDQNRFHRITYKLIDSNGNLSDDLSPPSDDLLSILTQMFIQRIHDNIKLEYHQSVWDYYKNIVSVEMAEPVIIGDIVTQVKAPRKPSGLEKILNEGWAKLSENEKNKILGR